MRHSEVERTLIQHELRTDLSAVSTRRWRLVFSFIFILALVLIGWLAARGITSEPAEKDAVENLANAFNLAFHGVYSSDKDPAELDPTMRREPLPNFVLAAWISLLPLSNVEDLAGINRGVNIQRLKLINIFWAVGVLLFTYLAAWSATRSIFAASLTSLALIQFVLSPGLIDRLMTELPAACLIAATSYFIMLTVQKGAAVPVMAAGVAGGLTALTKAVVFYLLPAVAVGLLAILLIRRSALRKALLLPSLFFVTSLLVTAPWIARNAIIFGEPQVASRAGAVLYLRMLYDNMSDVEYRGTLYAWSPPSIRKYVGAALGYKSSDLELGGSLQRLNRNLFTPDDRLAQRDGRPELATSYYSISRAERKRQANSLTDEFESSSGCRTLDARDGDKLDCRASDATYLADLSPRLARDVGAGDSCLAGAPYVSRALGLAFCKPSTSSLGLDGFFIIAAWDPYDLPGRHALHPALPRPHNSRDVCGGGGSDVSGVEFRPILGAD